MTSSKRLILVFANRRAFFVVVLLLTGAFGGFGRLVYHDVSKLLILWLSDIIAPWFNKFEPLSTNASFVTEILALADQVGFLEQADAMDGSKCLSDLNAYFTGIGKSGIHCSC